MQPSRLPLAGILLALGLTACWPAMAQTSPTAPGPAAAVPVTDAQIAAAREVIVASGAIRSFDSVLPAVAQQIRGTFSRQRPELAKDIDESLKVIQPELEAQREAMINEAARIYAQRLSEQELKDIAGFFKSPTGQKFVRTQPEIFDDLFREMQTWMGKVSDMAMARFRDEMKKRGHEL